MFSSFSISARTVARLSLCTLFLTVILETHALPGSPLRAAYRFSFGTAYSAAANLPQLQIVDLGAGHHPLALNDNLDVLLAGPEGQLLRWRSGSPETLLTRNSGWQEVFLNEAGGILALILPEPGRPAVIQYWRPGEKVPVKVDWNPSGSRTYYHQSLAAFNDVGQFILSTESETQPPYPPPSTLYTESFLLDINSGSRTSLAQFAHETKADWATSEKGSFWEVASLNNYGRSVGEYSAYNAFSDPFTGELTVNSETRFFALDRTSVLGFEPLRINDSGTILGRTPGPVVELIVQDAHGQRVIGPPLPELAGGRVLMTNPSDGLEEIVLESHYWKRMTERDFTGLPTGEPAPDFWKGSLEDLVPDPGPWSDLRATAVSANGRIAGIGSYRHPETGSLEVRAFLLIPAVLLPDWDRDGSIGQKDRLHAAKGLPWRLWINDDNDGGELSRSSADDLPGSETPNAALPGVDGLRDAVDFFPLQLDLEQLLHAVPDPSRVEIRLSQADSALNFTYAGLLPEDVGAIHTRPLEPRFGSFLSQPLSEARTYRITGQPVPLDPAFVSSLISENRGVLLIEGAAPSRKPLVLEVSRDGNPLLEASLALRVGPVEEMFRVLNLRNADPKFSFANPGPWTTDLSDPPGLPDNHLVAIGGNRHTLVHIHGFNWGSQDVLAVHAEVFKRFHQLGSHGRFVGVSWFANQGLVELVGSSFDYNENVINAFVTARLLKEGLSGLDASPVSLLAHSLGNIVASSAITDHQMHVANYFMLNAAVPAEAYLGEQDDRHLMVHPEWKNRQSDPPDYPEHLLAANWFRLFPSHDKRRFLTWKSRFRSISEKVRCLNFYSTAEDILRPGTGDLPNLLEDVWNREFIWTYNEMNKGTGSLTSSLTGDVHAGWGFNRAYMKWVDPGGAAHPPAGQWVPRSPAFAARISPDEIIAEPFFRPFSSGDPDFPLWGSGSWLYGGSAGAESYLPALPYRDEPVEAIKNHAKILAEGLPAHSAPAGATRLPNIPLLSNFNLDDLFRDPGFWPFRKSPGKRDRWLHGDYLAPALAQVAGFYLTCIKYINTLP